MLLSLRGISMHYGTMRAVADVDLDVAEGMILGLLEASGTGKSTLLKGISGLKTPTTGEVKLAGEVITGLPTARIIRKGVAHILEGRRLFPHMTVHQNLEMGAVQPPGRETRRRGPPRRDLRGLPGPGPQTVQPGPEPQRR